MPDTTVHDHVVPATTARRLLRSGEKRLPLFLSGSQVYMYVIHRLSKGFSQYWGEDRMGEEELKAQGNAAFKEGRFSEAVQHFTAAIALDPASHLLLSNRSGALAALGSYEAALADAERCLKLNPTWVKAHSRKGAALYGLGRYDEALATYEAGLAADPSNMQIEQNAADVRQKLAGARQLLEAAGKGDLEVVRSCLRSGIHPDGCCLPDGSSPLLVALDAGHVAVVAELIAKGASLARTNQAGVTAASLAQRSNDAGVLAALAAAGGGASTAAMGGGGGSGTASSSAAGAAGSKPSAASSIWGAAKGLAERSRAMAEKTRVAAEQKVADMKAAAEQKAAELQRQREERERVNEAARREAEEKASAEGTAQAGPADMAERAAAEAAAREEGERVAAEAAAAAAAERVAAEADEAEQLAEREALAEVSKQQGNEAFKAGHFPEAVRLYTQALEGTPSSAVLLSNRSGALAASGSYEAALDDAERCIALEPTWAKGHTRKASSLHGLGRFMAAVQVS